MERVMSSVGPAFRWLNMGPIGSVFLLAVLSVGLLSCESEEGDTPFVGSQNTCIYKGSSGGNQQFQCNVESNQCTLTYDAMGLVLSVSCN